MKRNFSAVLLVLLVFAGCQKKSAVKPPAQPPQSAPAAAPSAVIPPEPEPAPPEPSQKPAPLESAAPLGKILSPDDFELGVKDFVAGNYRQAAEELEKFLSANPKSQLRDQALFYLGLARALDSSRDLRQAEAAFRQLIAEFPNSHYKSQAEFILALQVQIEKLRSDVKERDDRIKKLSEELQVLKEIDLQRRPSRAE